MGQPKHVGRRRRDGAARSESRHLAEHLESRLLLAADPTLAWSTYISGGTYPGHREYGHGIVADPSGNVVMTGVTQSAHSSQALLVKMSPQGQQLWTRSLGGTGDDVGYAVATDDAGNILVAGTTDSADWVSGGFDTSFNGSSDVFVAKFSPDGQHVWSTYLGGGDSESAWGIAVDDSGDVLVMGSTFAAGWVSGGFDESHNDGSDVFLARLTPAGGHVWSTYIGGADDDYGYGLATDPLGNALVTGATHSPNSGWISGGWNTSFGGSGDGFVIKVSPEGQHVWSSYLGSTDVDYGNGIAADSAGNVLVTGGSRSADWTSGGFDTSHGGSADAFVVKLSPDGQHTWSTYLGGTAADNGYGITTDPLDNVLLTGDTASSAWVSGGPDVTYNGNGDSFVAKLTPDGQPLWSTYIGGTSLDAANAIATDADGNALLTGWTQSSGWVSGGFDTTYDGNSDAFVARITEFPTPILTGTAAADAFCLGVNPDNSQEILVYAGNAATGTPVATLGIQSAMPLVVRGIDGQDTLTIDLTHGNPLASIGLRIESGVITLDIAGGPAPIELPNLTLAPGVTLDLADNGLIVRNGDWNTLWTLIQSSRNGAAEPWTGAGLTSSLAAQNPGTGLVMARDDSGAIIIQYGLVGDINLDGMVDGDDCFLIDQAFLASTTPGHAPEDLNYDGQMDGQDYNLIDCAILTPVAMPATVFGQQPILAGSLPDLFDEPADLLG